MYNEFLGESCQTNHYFEIIWLKSGKGINKIDGVAHHYNGSVLFFLAPGHVYEITEQQKSEGYVLKFLPAVFKQEKDFIDYVFDTCLLDNARSCPVIGVPAQLIDVIRELFARFNEEFNRQQPGADIILSSYLKILTTHARRIKDSYLSKEVYINKPQYNLFRQFKIAVEQHYKIKHSVGDYANLLKTQARTLNMVARKYGSGSALEIIHGRIILEAKRRLDHDIKSIKELCYELGFEDPAYFTRFFKNNVGTAPQHFKISKTQVLSSSITS